MFRSDVFIFLFGGKGRACPHRLGKYFDFEDFSVEYFPRDWFIGSDRLGDSCRITFPIRMYTEFSGHQLFTPRMHIMLLFLKRDLLKSCVVCISKQRC